MDQPLYLTMSPIPDPSDIRAWRFEIQYVAMHSQPGRLTDCFRAYWMPSPGQRTTTIAGQKRPLPRLQCWMADQGRSYSYSGLKLASPRNPDVLRIKAAGAACEHSFNSVLLNYYRGGSDSVSWHADDETELGPKPIVASASLGRRERWSLNRSST